MRTAQNSEIDIRDCFFFSFLFNFLFNSIRSFLDSFLAISRRSIDALSLPQSVSLLPMADPFLATFIGLLSSVLFTCSFHSTFHVSFTFIYAVYFTSDVF